MEKTLSDIKNLLSHYQPRPIDEKRVYAVLLPLIKVNGVCHILYQVRAQHISQPGEVAFPGGRVEPGEMIREAAIRETMEELNLSADQVTIIGEMDYMVNGPRTIHCFVGQLLVEDWTQIQPNEEVERLFTLPLDLLLEIPPTYYDLTAVVAPSRDFPFERIPNGANYNFKEHFRRVPFYNQDNENLWGMTARFTHRFTEIVKNSPSDNHQLPI
ncbi:NUDIX hydrolase [Streptococcus rifensis]